MRIAVILGVLLIVLGVVALCYQSITFFTTERAVDAGPLKIDVQKPHTIILHPIVGIVALGAGLLLILSGRRASS